MRTKAMLCVLACLAAVIPAPAAAADPAPDSASVRSEWREVFSPDGSIRRVLTTRRAEEPSAPRSALAAAEVIPIEVNGPSESRFDLVFVGDGYTSSQFSTYGQHVRSKLDEIMAIEPFRSHRAQFNVWQVNVPSAQSGVDNDPTQGVSRSTALDMGFWCAGIERLLCVNETKARQYAAQARDVDQVLALGNSTKYGGAGGGVATASGGNAQSGQVAIHELGHSVGKLADEYTYGQGDLYTGPEPRESNVSIYQRATMSQYKLKWYRWLGQSTPDGGVIDTFTGGYYHQRGIYRPSDNSIMRTLGRQFNLPGREAMIAAFYRETGLIDAGAPDASSSVLWVKPIRSAGTTTTTWRIDGRPAGTGDRLDLAAARLSGGSHTVTATVTARTPWVRDPALQKNALTDSRTWTITR
ncbi:M64 family metallopeptidase [Spirillospora sp. CA-294931]|uniref:M64 family metallopeptidase n=1 Tax=Spirillospora sp. CA-294931 TaxID=3240042 RepID=UPI003D904AB7